MTTPWTYVTDHRKKPHVHPVTAPNGRVLTRVEPEDHPWHRGLWFTIKFVNEENFWEEMPPYGVLRHQDDTTVEWIRPDKETVAIREERTLTHVDLGAGAYAIDATFALEPQADTVFDRTEFTTWGGYGGLSFRGAGDWTDTRLLLDDGSEHERVLGTRSRWCDLSGPDAGVTFLDAPTNPSHPTPWYASTRAATYGDEGWSNFLNAAFLWDGPLHAPGGQVLRFDYRVIVHDGPWDAARVEAAYQEWAGTRG
jgi:hypothetical protein